MIDIKSQDGIAVLTLAHGKANALDIEFCEALASRFNEMRGSDAKLDFADFTLRSRARR